MLVLTRKVGERVICKTPSGERIEVVVVDARTGRIRVGIVAPHTVVIVREEIDGRDVAKSG